MTHGIRHTRGARAVDRSAAEANSQRTTVAAQVEVPSQEDDAPSEGEPTITERGRKTGSQTKLAIPLRGAKVALVPNGDLQFSYVNFPPRYKYTTQLGVILKREYPGLVEDVDQDGLLLRKRAALEWADYFIIKNELEVTNGDRVLSEFWRLFEVTNEDKPEVDRVLENYLKKRVRDMMYQARVDSVKVYYKKVLNQNLKDKLARPIELEYDQYKEGQLKWCDDQVWPYLCRYWCTAEFKLKRKRGQESRLSSEDPAQNRGGSRPFAETQQLLAVKFGPEKATPLNTYAVMKSGIKSVCSNGTSGPIRSCKAQKRMDDYMAGVRNVAHPEDDGDEHEELGEEEQEHEQVLNGQVLYDMSGGTPHGRLAIANGAVRAADIRAAAKERNVQPSSSMSFQSMAQEMARLRRENARLVQESQQNAMRHEKNEITTDLLLGLYRDLGKDIPAAVLQRLSATEAILTASSHAGSDSPNMMRDDGYGGMNGGCNSHPSENHGTS